MIVAESISSKINTDGPVLKFQVKVVMKFVSGVQGLEEIKALHQMIQGIIASSNTLSGNKGRQQHFQKGRISIYKKQLYRK